MRKVYQDQFGYGQGNCVWACVASIFELPLDSLRYPPPAVNDLAAWTLRVLPYRTFHYLDCATNYRLIDGPGIPSWEGPEAFQRWTYDIPAELGEAPTEGLWLASVPSLALKRPMDDPYYPLPSLHAVVMRGREIVHDPNPNYKISDHGSPKVVDMMWWTWT